MPITPKEPPGGISKQGLPGLHGTPAELDPEGRLGVSAGAEPVIAGVVTAPGEAAPPLTKGAVAGYSATGVAIWGHGKPAGVFQGDVQVAGAVTVSGTLTASDVILPNADCAEEFDVSVLGEPGDVMVLDPASSAGALRPCTSEYDGKVAGVISGAGAYRPALILDRRHASTSRIPIALVGKVYCKVDAAYGAIQPGDLLTTSPTPGHAMRASDRARCVGAILGKALAPIAEGRGLLPVLVALQ